MKEGSTENTKQEEGLKEELKFSSSNFFTSLIAYCKSIVNIGDEVDYHGSVEAIRKDIDFKGANVWVLGASIVIASIGLNVNSTAVVIGAMLISPLMGPIVGMGLAIGINDFKMLKRSLTSLGTAVLISILVSSVYFLLTPFGDVQSELIARTKPNLLDVLVAIFGGIALIVAKTQKGTIVSVIMGVAIATALMPPLCVAGYGLANGNWDFFFGAFYLFLINSVFIALSTLLIVKFLRFPLATYMNLKRQKRVKNYILIFSLLIIIPSGFTFWRTIQESIFKRNAENYISENFDFDGTWVSKKTITYNNDDALANIEIFLSGEIISEDVKKELTKRLSDYKLDKIPLKIHQFKDKTDEIAGKLSADVKMGILEEIYEKNEKMLQNKDEKINFLEDELIKMRKDTIPFSSVKREIKTQYKEVTSMSYGKTITTNFLSRQDTNGTFFIKWNEKITSEEITEKQTAMQNWLRVRLNDEKIRVLNY